MTRCEERETHQKHQTECVTRNRREIERLSSKSYGCRSNDASVLLGQRNCPETCPDTLMKNADDRDLASIQDAIDGLLPTLGNVLVRLRL